MVALFTHTRNINFASSKQHSLTKQGRAEYILSCCHCWPMHLTQPVKVITQPVMTRRMRKFCSVRPNQKFHYFRRGWKVVRLLIRLPGHGAE